MEKSFSGPSLNNVGSLHSPFSLHGMISHTAPLKKEKCCNYNLKN